MPSQRRRWWWRHGASVARRRATSNFFLTIVVHMNYIPLNGEGFGFRRRWARGTSDPESWSFGGGRWRWHACSPQHQHAPVAVPLAAAGRCPRHRQHVRSRHRGPGGDAEPCGEASAVAASERVTARGEAKEHLMPHWTHRIMDRLDTVTPHMGGQPVRPSSCSQSRGRSRWCHERRGDQGGPW
jgi:hypothetical protein